MSAVGFGFDSNAYLFFSRSLSFRYSTVSHVKWLRIARLQPFKFIRSSRKSIWLGPAAVSSRERRRAT